MPRVSNTSSSRNSIAFDEITQNKIEYCENHSLHNRLCSVTSFPDVYSNDFKSSSTHTQSKILNWLKMFSPVNNKKPLPEIEQAYMRHTLLQQSGDISAELQERLTSPESPPFRLKWKAGLFIAAGILTGATAGTLAFRYYSAQKTNVTAPSPPFMLALSEMRNNPTIKLYYAEDKEYIRPVLNSDNLIVEQDTFNDNKTHTESTEKYKRRTGIIAFLKQRKLLTNHKENSNVKKESLVSAVAKYIYHNESDNLHPQKHKEKKLARHILADTDLYGGRKGEPISSAFAQSVIGNWMFRQILGMSPGEYIVKKINSNVHPSYFTISSLRHILNMNKLLEDGLLVYENIPPNQWGELNVMWHFYLINQIPIMKLPEKDIDSILLGSQDFADLYVGAALLDEGYSLKSFTLNEIIKTGTALWDIAIHDGIDIGKSRYFISPSLIALTSKKLREIKNNSFSSHISALNDYIQYRREVSAAQQELTKKITRYKSAINAWISKGTLADNIISDCPDSELASFPDIADGIRSQQQMRKKKESITKQLYMNGIIKPCKGAPEKLNDAYGKLTAEVADSLFEIDKLLIWSALISAEKNESDFFSSSEAKIHLVNFSMHTDRPVGVVHSVGVDTNFWVKPKNTDLFAVTVGNQERIYALNKKESDQIATYKIIRVDRNIRNYIDNGLLDCDCFSKNYIVQDDKVIDSDTFIFKILPMNSPVHHLNNEYHPVVSYYSKAHRDIFYNMLYEYGNNKSDLQKIWSIAKHLIPFYDCIDGIINDNTEQTIPACLMDIIALIPVAGKATSMGSHFSMTLTKGAQHGGSALIRGTLSNARAVLLRDITLPKINDILELNRSALKAIDPGFELLTRGGKILHKKLDSFLRQKADSIALAEKISSFGSANVTPVISKEFITARLPHSDIEVPVQKIGKDPQDNIYVLVNPDTGENFGKHYTMLTNNRLAPVKISISQQKTRHKGKVTKIEINRMDQHQQYLQSHNQLTDISQIPAISKFLPPTIDHLPRMQLNNPPYGYSIVQPHLSEDFTEMGVAIKNFAKTNYHQNDVFFCRFNQNSDDIPYRFSQLKNNFQQYKDGVLLAKEYANKLNREFTRTTMENIYGELQFPPKGNRIEAYLSKILNVNSIVDADIALKIKKEAMIRLRFHTKKITDYLNNEIDNIYFASCHSIQHPYIYNADSPMGFVCTQDNFRRIIVMVDNYHSSPLLSTQLHLSVLHETSHLSGTLDFQVAPSTSQVGDASEFIESFNDGVLGINGEYIDIDEKFIDAYRREYPHINIHENQFRELLKRDPVLRANVFMDNADFLARIISDLASRTRYNNDLLDRRQRQITSPKFDISLFLYKLVMMSMSTDLTS